MLELGQKHSSPYTTRAAWSYGVVKSDGNQGSKGAPGLSLLMGKISGPTEPMRLITDLGRGGACIQPTTPLLAVAGPLPRVIPLVYDSWLLWDLKPCSLRNVVNSGVAPTQTLRKA